MISPDPLKEIKVLKENERQRISVVEDDLGKRYIKREINDDKSEIYKALQKADHPNIPKIYSVSLSDRTVVIEEFIEGKSLALLMEQKKTFSKNQICSIAKQVLSALERLHGNKIIHRDIKPDNILIDDSDRVFLIDYDIARIYREELRKDTESMGTFGYAPIEQFGMLPTDFKTDIYAFGVTLKALLDHAKIKGFLYKIADKCGRLDPGQRYKSAAAVRWAIECGKIKMPLIGAIAIALVISALLIIFSIVNAEPEDEGINFLGFEYGVTETEYGDEPRFYQSAVFLTDEPWDHLLLLDDMNKKGRIRLDKNIRRINADITLDNGELSVLFDDKRGHKFSHVFKYSGQYPYDKIYTDDLRRTADIICRDLDYDDIPEILIGLGESSMSTGEHRFYNSFNYTIAWCIKYDEDKGFTLCEGDMFAVRSYFKLSSFVNNLIVPWEKKGDVMAYYLEDGKIKAVIA